MRSKDPAVVPGFEGDVSPDASHGMVEDRAVLLHDNTYSGSDRPGKLMDGGWRLLFSPD